MLTILCWSFPASTLLCSDLIWYIVQESPSNSARFVSPLSECEFVISGALDELQKDAWPAPQGHRPARCTGTALQVQAVQRLSWQLLTCQAMHDARQLHGTCAES